MQNILYILASKFDAPSAAVFLSDADARLRVHSIAEQHAKRIKFNLDDFSDYTLQLIPVGYISHGEFFPLIESVFGFTIDARGGVQEFLITPQEKH